MHGWMDRRGRASRQGANLDLQEITCLVFLRTSNKTYSVSFHVSCFSPINKILRSNKRVSFLLACFLSLVKKIEATRRKQEALEHIKFCVKLYRIQQSNGRYFLHEHPRSASSWHGEVVMSLCRDAGVYVAVVDQCRYGLTSVGFEGKGPAHKPTRFMTNSPDQSGTS